MDRSVEKIDESHDRTVLRMAGTIERDKWARTFPDPMPGTHVLAYRWEDRPGGMHLIIEPALRVSPALAGAAGTTQPLADPKAEAKARVMAELTGKSDVDLETLAAERGVAEGYPKKQTRKQREAFLLEKLAK